MENRSAVDGRAVDLAVGWFRDIWAALAEDRGEVPLPSDLLALLVCTLQEGGQTWIAADGRSTVGLQELIWRGQTPGVASGDRDASAKVSSKQSQKSLDDLSDWVFTTTEDGLAAFYRATKQIGTCSSFEQLSLTLEQALTLFLAQVSGKACEGKLELKVRKANSPKAKIGDVVAIPTSNGAFYAAIVISENRFGTALGVFLDPHLQADINLVRSERRLPYAVYTGQAAVKSSRWPLIGHRPDWLNLFPAEPEIFHSKRDVLNATNPQIGPHGSAETPAGKLRSLSADEAAGVRLTSGLYQQLFLESFLENQLPLLVQGS